MSASTVELEPLLYFMHEHGSGSWAQFIRAVKQFHPESDAFSVARGLSEHGLVEFFWDGKKNWSVTPATAVVANRPNGRIGLWGGTHRAARRLSNEGIQCQIERRRIIRPDVTYEYMHAVAIDVPSAAKLKPYVTVVNSSDIASSLLALEDVLLKAPLVEPPSSSASTYRYVYSFGGGSVDTPTPFVADSPSLWRVGSRRFIFVRNNRIRLVPGWLGKWLIYSAEREETYAALFVQEGGIFSIPFAPLLPPPYIRALLFSGSAEIPPTQFGSRCFANVEESIARDICAKLSIEAQIVERRIRERS